MKSFNSPTLNLLQHLKYVVYVKVNIYFFKSSNLLIYQKKIKINNKYSKQRQYNTWASVNKYLGR